MQSYILQVIKQQLYKYVIMLPSNLYSPGSLRQRLNPQKNRTEFQHSKWSKMESDLGDGEVDLPPHLKPCRRCHDDGHCRHAPDTRQGAGGGAEKTSLHVLSRDRQPDIPRIYSPRPFLHPSPLHPNYHLHTRPRNQRDI